MAIRGAQLGPHFQLAGEPYYYNVYHPNDPVAYRLEPLLAESSAPCAHDRVGASASSAPAGGGGVASEDCGGTAVWRRDEILPAELVPFTGAKDGQRMHVHLRQVVQKVEQDVRRAKANVLNVVAGVTNVVQGWLPFLDLGGTRSRPSADELAAGLAAQREAEREAAARLQGRFYSYALNGGGRVDWVLQESEIEVANEYVSAMQAHSSYFASLDLASFIINVALARQNTHATPATASSPEADTAAVVAL